GRPTVVPFQGFNATADAEALRKAMKGFGTDEAAIIQVLSRRTADQRMDILRAYKANFGKDLIKDLKSELSGNFERAILALMHPRAEYLAMEVREAIKGAGTQEGTLVEILAPGPNDEIAAICDTYYKLYGKSMEDSIASDTSGDFKRLLVALCQGQRDEYGVTDNEVVMNDAHRLYSAGEGKLGTEESAFIQVLATRSFQHLKQLQQEYVKITGRELEDAVASEFSGNIEKGLTAVSEASFSSAYSKIYTVYAAPRKKLIPNEAEALFSSAYSKIYTVYAAPRKKLIPNEAEASFSSAYSKIYTVYAALRKKLIPNEAEASFSSAYSKIYTVYAAPRKKLIPNEGEASFSLAYSKIYTVYAAPQKKLIPNEGEASFSSAYSKIYTVYAAPRKKLIPKEAEASFSSAYSKIYTVYAAPRKKLIPNEAKLKLRSAQLIPKFILCMPLHERSLFRTKLKLRSAQLIPKFILCMPLHERNSSLLNRYNMHDPLDMILEAGESVRSKSLHKLASFLSVHILCDCNF
ncbi:hypothetical protein QYM36_000344, partial [Artemia franciscana]